VDENLSFADMYVNKSVDKNVHISTNTWSGTSAQTGISRPREPRARPPKTLMYAAVGSGRSFMAISLPAQNGRSNVSRLSIAVMSESPRWWLLQ
jgi:hypothetical protein